MQSLPDQEEFMSVVKSAWVGGPRTHRQHDHHRQLSCRVILASNRWTRFFRELDNLCRNDKIFPFRSGMFVACFDEAVKQQIRFEAKKQVSEKVTQTCDALSKSDNPLF